MATTMDGNDGEGNNDGWQQQQWTMTMDCDDGQ